MTSVCIMCGEYNPKKMSKIKHLCKKHLKQINKESK
jgi:hypothetical protein